MIGQDFLDSPRLNRWCSAFLLLVSFLLFHSLAMGAAKEPARVSNRGPALAVPTGAGEDSFAHASTPDGRWVVFSSAATDLVASPEGAAIPRQVPPVVNVYLRDRLSHTTRLVTQAADGWSGADDDCTPAGISSDGRFVLYETAAGNVQPGVSNGFVQVFVRDMVAGTNLLVSAAPNGTAANQSCRSATITPDGRYVAFVSRASNLVAGDNNAIEDVFIRDIGQPSVECVSVGARQAAGATCDRPLLSENGRFVAFSSSAPGLVQPGPPLSSPPVADIYLRDRLLGTTTWVSRDAGPLFQGAYKDSIDHAMSRDGQWIAYHTTPTYSTVGPLLLFDVANNTTTVVATNMVAVRDNRREVSNMACSTDGAVLAFVADLSKSKSTNALTVWSATTKSNSIIATTAGSTNRMFSRGFALDPSGRFLAFIQQTVAADMNPSAPALVAADLEAGTTTVANLGEDGTALEVLAATQPFLSWGGTNVVFEARESSLSRQGATPFQVYARDLATSRTDLVSTRSELLDDGAPDNFSALTTSSVSHDGGRVLFYSFGTDLVAGDTNQAPDLFAHDMASQSTWLVSANSNGLPGNAISMQASMSADGRFVAYASAAADLCPGDTNMTTDVFVRDLLTGENMLASARLLREFPGAKASLNPHLSSDGTKLLFQTFSSGIAFSSSYLAATHPDLIYRDLTTRSNRSLGTAQGTGPRFAMSKDGTLVALLEVTSTTHGRVALRKMPAADRVVLIPSLEIEGLSALAFDPPGRRLACATNSFSSGCVAYFDLARGSNIVVSTRRMPSYERFSFSADANLMAFSAGESYRKAGTNRVYVHDFRSKATIEIGALAGEKPHANNDYPVMSPDGRFVVYRSYSPSASGGAALASSLVLYDLQSSSRMVLAKRDGLSIGPSAFSGDGRTIAVSMKGSQRDFSPHRSVYAFRVGPGGDIPLLYSFLQPSPEGWLLSWPVESGKTYSVEYKSSLDDPAWTPLNAGVVITGSEGKLLDTERPQQRYYRVVAR